MSHRGRASAPSRTRKHRRAGRSSRDLTISFHPGPAPGPGVVSASIEEVLDALTRAPKDLDWPSLAHQVVPVMPRVRPYPPGTPEPVRTLVPPGVVVGFAVDIGPAYLTINARLLEGWGLTLADVTAQALANLHERAATIDPGLIVREPIGGVPTAALQTGVHVGSTLVLAPAEVRRLFGPERRLFLTPMRDLIVALPADVDRSFALWLHHEFADLDPSCLGPLAYRFDGQSFVTEQLERFGPGVGIVGNDPGSTSVRVA